MQYLEEAFKSLETMWDRNDEIQNIAKQVIYGDFSYLKSYFRKNNSSSNEIKDVIIPASEELIKYIKNKQDLIFKISSRQFEELIADILKNFGWDVELTAATKDGGYDIFAISKDLSGMKSSWIIECKKYRRDRKVGIEAARSLYSVKNEMKVSNAIIATTSTFTKGVHDFSASRYDFSLRDYDGIMEWLKVSNGYKSMETS